MSEPEVSPERRSFPCGLCGFRHFYGDKGGCGLTFRNPPYVPYESWADFLARELRMRPQ